MLQINYETCNFLLEILLTQMYRTKTQTQTIPKGFKKSLVKYKETKQPLKRKATTQIISQQEYKHNLGDLSFFEACMTYAQLAQVVLSMASKIRR